MDLYEFAKKKNLSLDSAKKELSKCGIYIFNDDNIVFNRTQELQIEKYFFVPKISNEIETNSKKVLEDFVKDYLIFIDTCSIRLSWFPQFMKNIQPFLQKYNKYILVPEIVAEELKRSAIKDKNSYNICVDRLNLLNDLYNMGLVRCVDSNYDKSQYIHADPIIISDFTRLHCHYNLLLITRDAGLSNDILNLNKQKSIRTKYVIKSKRINKYGYLSNLDKPFSICTTPIDITIQTMSPKHIPNTSDVVVTDDGNKLILGNFLNGGTEGSVYAIQNDKKYVVKIFKNTQLTPDKIGKLTTMIDKRDFIDCSGIVWPISKVYNNYGEFVGYLMDNVNYLANKKVYCLADLFSISNGVKQNFKDIDGSNIKDYKLTIRPHWTRKNIITLAKTILEKVKFLNQRNIIIGDYNLNNILFEDENTVYFIDTDSYQLDHYPCTVLSEDATSPEFYLDNMNGNHRVMRTMADENFSVAVLTFKLLMMDTFPYENSANNKSMLENMVEGNFSYPLSGNTNKSAPQNQLRYLWSHLKYNVKYDFYHTFHHSGDYFNPQNRKNSSDWYRTVSKYLADYDLLIKNDLVSGFITPMRYKYVERRCIKCNAILNNAFTHKDTQYCEKCLNRMNRNG